MTPLETFPEKMLIEGIPVSGFPNPQSLFERLILETRKAGQSVVYYLNVHVCNTAYQNAPLKKILRKGDIVYCDGAGVVMASKLLGQPLPTRLTAADWLIDMLAAFAQADCKVFLLGGEPGVPEKAMAVIRERLPEHSVVGVHHGYILKDESLEKQVIQEINDAKPDILIVGFGTPLQEEWIHRHRHALDVSVVYAIGAVMDYISGKVSRCPAWMGQNGLEWLYRFAVEPGRMFARYLIGNPWFLGRIVYTVAQQQALSLLPKMPVPQR